MASPFRYNKKERRRWRKAAKRAAKSAHKLAADDSKPEFLAASQMLADLDTKISQAKRRKKDFKSQGRTFTTASTCS